MAHPLEKVKIGIDDPNCRGVTSSNGRVRYDATDHVVEVPRVEADRLLKTSLVMKMGTSVAMNRPVTEAHFAYEMFCEANESIPYMKWYREHWQSRGERSTCM